MVLEQSEMCSDGLTWVSDFSAEFEFSDLSNSTIFVGVLPYSRHSVVRIHAVHYRGGLSQYWNSRLSAVLTENTSPGLQVRFWLYSFHSGQRHRSYFGLGLFDNWQLWNWVVGEEIRCHVNIQWFHQVQGLQLTLELNCSFGLGTSFQPGGSTWLRRLAAMK
jgi:hypothetical protein